METKIEKLKELLDLGTSPYQVVDLCKKRLVQAGYAELSYEDEWRLEAGGRYFVSPYPSSLFAFAAGDEISKQEACVRIAMAHTDFPCFKLKSKPECVTKGYLQVNVEPYGGMIKSSWFDRPLGVAGKVVLASDEIYQPKVVHFDSKRALFVIPSLAPHMSGAVNKEQQYDMQSELLPILGMLEKQCNQKGFFMEYLAGELQVPAEDILSFDLFLYNMDSAVCIGQKQDMLCAPRIDNLLSVSALIEAMDEDDKNHKNLSLTALFDNEEIGSRSKQGADSVLLATLLEKISKSLFGEMDALEGALARGFLLSVDGAHALHPNYVSKSDITNEVLFGGGPVIKTSASQRYISDSEGTAILIQLCRKYQIPYQVQVNRSGMPGGQTLGPIASSYLPMQGADIGVPMLAMHSARELAMESDYKELVKLLTAFYM